MLIYDKIIRYHLRVSSLELSRGIAFPAALFSAREATDLCRLRVSYRAWNGIFACQPFPIDADPSRLKPDHRASRTSNAEFGNKPVRSGVPAVGYLGNDLGSPACSLTRSWSHHRG